MPLLTRAEAAAFCRVSVDSFDAHVRPELPELGVGRRVLFRRVDVEAWAANPDDRRARPGLAPKPPPPQLSADARRFVRGLLTRGQRVRLGVGTPDEVEIEAAIQARRKLRERPG